jgi:hypothetical protein
VKTSFAAHHHRLAVMFTVAAIAFIAIGCGGGSSSAKHFSSSDVSATLSVTPNAIQAGKSAMLSWSTSNADSVTIEGIGTVDTSGSLRISPAQPTTYTLKATGKTGSQKVAVMLNVTQGPPKTNGVPRSSHVVLVIEENHMFEQVYPAGMPWLTFMGDSYAFATNYHANEPGSALDYFWLSSGSGEHAFGCTGSGCSQPISSDNIFHELSNAGISWKLYAEGLPYAGYLGGNKGAYVDRHNPAKWYADVINSPSLQQNLVPFAQFAADLAADQLPAYSLIIPDVNHDAHDGTLAEADGWLQANFDPLLNHPSFQPGGDGLLIVTFDECDAAVGACSQQVFTAVIGPNVKRRFQSNVWYRHENTLRTILDAFGVTLYPGASQTAADMADLFQ